MNDPLKDPNTYSLLQYLGILIIALWGGMANYFSRIKRGIVPHFSFIELLGELVISGFSGVLIFWLCEAMNINPLLTAAYVGIAGHAGGRAVFLIEQIMIKRLENLANKVK